MPSAYLRRAGRGTQTATTFPMRRDIKCRTEDACACDPREADVLWVVDAIPAVADDLIVVDVVILPTGNTQPSNRGASERVAKGEQ